MGLSRKLIPFLPFLFLFNAHSSFLSASVYDRHLHHYIAEHLQQAEQEKATLASTFKVKVDQETDFNLPVELSFAVGRDILAGGKFKTLAQLQEVFARSSPMAHHHTKGACPSLVSCDDDEQDDDRQNLHITFSTANALQLVSGSVHCPDCSVVNRITQKNASIVAHYQLADLLMRPTTDISVLELRKKLVSTLLEDSHSKAGAPWASITMIRQAEPYVMDLMSRDSALFNDVFTQVVIDRGNGQSAKLLSYATGVMDAILWLYLIKNVAGAGQQLYAHWNLAVLCTLSSAWKLMRGFVSYFSGPLMVYGMDKGIIEPVVSAYWEGPILRYTERLSHLQSYVKAVKELFAWIKALGVSDLLEYSWVMASVDQPNSELACLIGDIELGRFHCTKPTGSAIKELAKIELLTHVHDTDVFIDFMRAAGEIEAWFHVARLKSRMVQNRQTVYAFANFLEEDEPAIHLKDFWSPLVGQQVSVTNDFILNSNTPRIYVVSGPNAGGKTTAINAMALSLLMAQTLTVVPAKSLAVTPFSLLETSTFSQGNSDLGLSSYQAEAENAFTFINDSLMAERGLHKTFIFIDEPFVGTNCDSAEIATTSLLEVLASQRHTVAMTTYHPCSSVPAQNSPFSPIWLADKDPQTFGNLHVRAEVTRDGKIRYSYKLHEGASDQSVGLDIFDSLPNTPGPFLDKVHIHRNHSRKLR